MARSSEPFPRVDTASASSTMLHANQGNGGAVGPRPRRKSSGLGGELPGDSDVAALATLSPPTTPTVSRSSSEASARRPSKRRRVKKLFKRWKAFSFRHTWVNPLVLCLIIVAGYLLNPTESNPLHACLFLSYPLPREPDAAPDAPIMYGKGAKDFAFVAFYTIFLSFTREFLMQRLIRPLAVAAGIRKRGKQSRFMEQVYTAIYFGIFGPFGLWVMRQTPIWYFNTTAMYEGFPHRSHASYFKAYYLLQAAYWAQQAIVLCLMLEKPRKDFKELVAHHIITLALIWLSYRFHFTYMGLAVYITHDISDFFLATSKTLNYLDWPIVGPYFFLFMCVWTYLRHYINLRILWSILTEFATVGPYELNWETQQYKCWISQIITFTLLASLQAVNLFWLWLIFRIAYRFVASFGQVKEDERSEDEDSEEEEVEQGAAERKQQQQQQQQQLMETVEGAPEVLVNGERVLGGPAEGDVRAEKVTNGSANGNGRVLRERKGRK